MEDSIMYQLFNAKYIQDTIRTVNKPDNTDIINNLTNELEKNDFSISAHTVENEEPEYRFVFDCVKHIQYNIESTGMRTYSVKSNSKKIKYNSRAYSKKKLRSYYYEFKICVYEFDNEEIATKNYELLDEVSHAGDGNCNRTFNTRYVVRKNEIFEFSTMSDRSLNYMKEYMSYVEGH
ncbi:hypothetical protein NG800_014660 [Epilithonimonas ginsengisoli]|uniref:Uncharacterized protein n=1 Tax=Epilithonimonas ginsengisoli TaxID=1245592 RepID=A0ABU4JKJ1_9FLAO|nr:MULTISPECIES: hypothetical protein [Chryseobacterium group]MBV6881198.1 hypothetical protein [Epilithonimonas sp. FP105]MDW8550166.1 hypothetical protein [Epilithonimonas ginsengisoli]OAH70624.1 hypothetical protein AXA65_12980 [Chryseobacterium sp. FP211-J200]